MRQLCLIILFLSSKWIETCLAEVQVDLLAWFQGQQGTFFDVERQRVVLPQEDDSKIGVYAKQNIRKGEILVKIPLHLILAPVDRDIEQEAPDELSSHFHCHLARRLILESELGMQSKWGPYIQHLKEKSERNPLPSLYSRAGQELLLEVLGGEDTPYMLMDKAVQYVFWDWEELCNEDSSTSSIAMLVPQYAHLDLMIPMKDLYTHRNGAHFNVDLLITESHIQIVALRPIKAGESLHLSLDHCETCQENDSDNEYYGTPELFRDHGIIEEMPQKWVIPEGMTVLPYIDEDGEEALAELNGIMMGFRLDQNETTGGVDVTLEFDEIDTVLYPFVDTIFRQRIQQLHYMKNIEFRGSADEYGIPSQEWDAVWKFHHAYATALKLATIKLHERILELDFANDVRQKEFYRSIDSWEDHYTDFHVELNHLAYNAADCESSEMVDFWTYQPYELERSNYQEMFWQYRPEDDDTCLHLDGMLQICSSYRPHYHEFFVHFPARYLNSIRRVIFLGSGDAMLLHEILKYPSLEKVVGLELDQTVTRKSFKHFKTQPHYDDPRVEWWYGDATKTLPLLPRDYWGSFDLLLVDLSETVVSLHVTGKHDVLDVISMLLKPEGVMLENELYIDKMSRHFDHTAHIFYGSPKVCTQVHTISSNSADFLRAPIYDHGVEMYLIDKVENDTERFRFFHDYVKTSASENGNCLNTGDDYATIEYGRKSGILMVLEAEAIVVNLDETLEMKIRALLKANGLTPLMDEQKSDTKNTFQIAMKEGYITGRMCPTYQYVAFDVHFWGAFSKMEVIRDALTDIIGSKITSSYRVVTGGMQGCSTWNSDQNEIGIQFSQKRGCPAPDSSGSSINTTEVITTSLDETLNLLDNDDQTSLVAVVACGLKSTSNICLTNKILEENPKITKVVPIWACEDIPSFNDGSFPFETMYECEKSILSQIESIQDTIGAFVVDLDVPLSMLQIFVSVWSIGELRDEKLDHNYVISLPYQSSDDKRRQFMDLFRKFGHGAAGSMAEFVFSSMPETLEWRVFAFQIDEAVRAILEMEKGLQKRLKNTAVMARLLEGGQLHQELDLLLEERSFRPEDYDITPNQQQMETQRPLGRQTILQFDLLEGHDALQGDLIVKAFEETLQKMGYSSRVNVFQEVGDGLLTTATYDSGDSILIWDGLHHVDVNVFNTDESRDLADTFLQTFLNSIDNKVQLSLRDDQPRGFGRVVNFQSDIDRDNMATIQR